MVICLIAEGTVLGRAQEGDHVVVFGTSERHTPKGGRPRELDDAAFDQDLAETVAKAAGLPYRIVEKKSDAELLAALQSGEIDAISSLARSPRLEGKVMFTIRHTASSLAVFMRADRRAPRSVAEVSALRLAVAKDSSGQDYVAGQHWGDRVRVLASTKEALQAVQAGQVDACIANQFVGVTVLRALGREQEILPDFVLPDYTVDYCMAVRISDVALLDQLNDAILLAYAQGDFQRIREKWLPVAESLWLSRKTTLRWFALGGAGLVLLAGASWWWHRDRLRAQHRMTEAVSRLVEERTRELGENSIRMNLAMQATGVGLWEWNLLTNRIRWDRQMFQIYGLAPTADGFVQYGDWSAAVVPEDLPQQEAVMQATVRDRGTSTREFHIVRRGDGQTRVLQAVETVRTNASGQVEWVVGTNLDITERKAAEKSLQFEQQLFAELSDTIPDALYFKDRQCRFIRINRPLAAALGLKDPSEAIGRTDFDFFDLAHAQAAYDDEQRIIATGEPRASYEERVVWPGGRVSWVLSSKAPLRDAEGQITGLVGSSRDITQRREAEAHARHLAAIVEHSNDAIISKDLHGVITSWNRGAETVFGYPAAEIVGQSILRLIPPDRQPEEADLLKAAERGESIQHFETIRRRKNGRALHVSLALSPIRDATGKIVGVSTVIRDITPQKQAEAERLALEAQLRQSQKMEAIGTLAGGIAHDFNNILSGIYGYTSLAQRAARHNPELRGYLDEIDSAGQRAADLVRQILTFSRTRSSDAVMEPMDLGKVVAEAVKLLRATIPSSIELVLHQAPELPLVQGNASQLHQIIMNLGTNAVHAMGESIGRLTIRLDCVAVDEALARTLRGLPAGSFLRLSVIDTGCGMSQATQARVFEPFFTTKDPGRGTGLGLAVVDGIVRTHRGAIQLTSEVGRGTKFEIYLPVAETQTAVGAAPVEVIPRGRGERILLVDDEPQIAKFGQFTLSEFGYTAECETDVLKAWAQIEADPQAFDLVISDQTMPGMNGLQFAERIRARRADLPVVLTTGFSALLTPERLHASGVREVLAKPYTTADFIAMVQRHLPRSPAS